MKKILIFLGLIIWFSTFEAYAVDVDESVRSGVQESFEIIGSDADAIDVSELLDRLSRGDFSADGEGIWNYVKNAFSKSVNDNYGFVFKLLIIILLVSVINMLGEGKKQNRAVRLFCVSIVALNVIGVFTDISSYCVSVTDKLVLFINSLIPVLMTLMAAGGNVTSAGVLNPVMLGASSILSLLVKSLLIPLIFVAFSFKISGIITEREHITELGKQIFALIKWCTGLLMTVYVGIITIIGTAAPHVDEITIKTAKYAVSSFVPYVGGMLSDSVELLLNCSHVVKSSVGILGLIGVLLVAAVPCISIAVKALLLNLLSVAAAPLTDSGTRSVIKEAASCVSVFLGMLVVVCVMYLISVTVIIFVGGA